MHSSGKTLMQWKTQIADFLGTLKLELHPEKSKIYPLHGGVNFLGYRIFYHHALLRRSNVRVMENRMSRYESMHKEGCIPYEKVAQGFESWMSYAKYANSYNLRRDFAKRFNHSFNPRFNAAKENLSKT
jgi:RNA-directed DNA polymerase